MKYSLEEIQNILSAQVKSSDVVDAVLKELEKLGEEKKEEKAENATPKLKNEYVIVVMDEDGAIAKSGLSTGYIIKMKKDDDAGAVLSKLSAAARIQNEGKKQSKNPLLAISEVFAHLKSKFLKLNNSGLKIATPEPVRVLFSSNRLI